METEEDAGTRGNHESSCSIRKRSTFGERERERLGCVVVLKKEREKVREREREDGSGEREREGGRREL